MAIYRKRTPIGTDDQRCTQTPQAVLGLDWKLTYRRIDQDVEKVEATRVDIALV